jgi:arylsulfatase
VGHVVDIAPTIVQLAGGKWPEQVGDEKVPATPGQSLVDSFHQADAQRQSSLWWLHEGNRALRSGNWKAVAAKDEQWQLYDLSKDRSETHNLADQEPETLKRLVAEWEATTQQIAKDSQ